MSDLARLAAAAPWFFPLVAFLVGACVGSFLNVVIARLPAGDSIVTPRSHCDCGAPIAWHDNLPLVSWFVLRGRARCCGRLFSIRYWFVEALTAGLFLACWLLLPPARALCGWVFLSGLIAATFIDLEHLVIPDVLTLGLGLAGVALSCLVPALQGQSSGLFALDSVRAGTAAAEGVCVGSGLVLWTAILGTAALKKEAMGLGDALLVGGIGAFCGWKGAIFALFGGAGVGVIWFALAFCLRPLRQAPPSEPLGFGMRVPFGPMLAIAGALYFLVLRHPVDAWFERLAPLF
ncbi:MAG TPA: prepilin peptidase [Opitutaceae bacterium]|jgi:leader peptidase (prepilin peptidase)/N-methyltransferase|nr:prepilin peptidase [Opitutaceae bacterium]